MTLRTVVHCNGLLGNRACRNTLSLTHASAAKVRERATENGWTTEEGRDYCPACTRHRAVIRARQQEQRP